MPPKDPVLAPGLFGEGDHGPRHFDFSDAPDVPGFHHADECNAEYVMWKKMAYNAYLRTCETFDGDFVFVREEGRGRGRGWGRG